LPRKKKIIGIGREVKGRKKDGTVFPIDLTVSEMQLGEAVHFAGIIRDLTQKKEIEAALQKSEQRFRFLFDTVGTVILCLCENYNLIEWNNESERLIGWPRERILGRDFIKLCVPVQIQNKLIRDLKTVYSGEMLLDYECPIVTQAGEERILLWNICPYPLHDSEDNQPKIIASGHDITDYKKLLQEYLNKKSLAQLGELAAVVAHEVKNPIASISGALRVITTRMNKEDNNRSVISEILDRLVNLNTIVNDLLFFAKPQKPEIQKVPFDLLLEDCIRILKEDPTFTNVRLKANKVQCCEIPCDSNMIRAVVTNILINAGQAMKGEGEITVEIQRNDSYCTISFADTGPGIAIEIANKIFEPFVTTKARGTGLGLAIAKRFIEQHRGSISLDGNGGGGTIISITLPCNGHCS
jgi:PAS domain S-box-containing protein